MSKTPKLYNADGSLTKYGLSCGYIESTRKGDSHLTMWLEHNCYHVRLTNDHGRVFWDVFDKLGDARKRYNQAKRGLK
jgi:hypothetical protein